VSQALVKRVQKLEDQVHALQQMLLSHVVAFDMVDRLGTDATLELAVSQLDSALDRGRGRVAANLAGLIQDVQKCRN
jgi:hypothetical protein